MVEDGGYTGAAGLQLKCDLSVGAVAGRVFPLLLLVWISTHFLGSRTWYFSGLDNSSCR